LKSLPTDKEVGIVTFNTKQRDLLEDMIEKKNLEVSNLFVRNLEEVQGDERDIIIFSIGYGPNEEGKFIHNFGPLNREGGEKRLNVAITRARERVIVVTSILPSQLNVDNAKHLGSKFLKLYLEYAWACQERDSKEIEKLLSNEIIKIAGPNRQESKKKYSSLPLEKEVYDELVKLGYEIDFQRGSIGR
jgi:superfamily I DNA and/or RNA helicase